MDEEDGAIVHGDGDDAQGAQPATRFGRGRRLARFFARKRGARGGAAGTGLVDSDDDDGLDDDDSLDAESVGFVLEDEFMAHDSFASVEWFQGTVPDEDDSRQHETWKAKLNRFLFYCTWENMWLYLLLLGFCTASAAVLSDVSVSLLYELRLEMLGPDAPYMARYFMFVLTGVGCALVAGAATRFISPASAGSGIPFVKTILSGVALTEYLSVKCLVAKFIGIIGAQSSGLFVGKEGPYVHMSTAIAKQLADLPIFERFRRNEAIRLQLLSAGCAVGVSSTFGAPIGGVLFSIEVTSMYYMVHSLWMAVFTAVAAALTVQLLNSDILIALFSVKFEPLQVSAELIMFGFIGLVCGALSVHFIKMIRVFTQVRQQLSGWYAEWYVQIAIVALATTVITFPLQPTLGLPRQVINELFAPEDAPLWGNWSSNVIINLVAFIVIKFYLTAVSIVLPIPCGLYTPIFVTGAAIGRLTGEIVARIFPSLHVVPGGYAVCGAAALAAGTTHTVSTAVIVFELTGQLDYMLPVLISTLISIAVTRQFTFSIYDTLLTLRGLPFMPNIRRHKALQRPAKELMRTDLVFLSLQSTYEDVRRILQTSLQFFPFVDSPDAMKFLGSIPRSNLERALDEYSLEMRTRVRTRSRSRSRHRSSTSLSQGPPSTSAADTRIVPDPENEPVPTRKSDGVELQVMPTTLSEMDHPSEGGLGNVITVDRSGGPHQAGQISCDPAPLTFVAEAPLWKVFFFCGVVGLQHAYILDGEKYVGVVTKTDLNRVVQVT